MTSPQLHHTIHGTGPTMVLIHGLFGSLSNLGLLARDFVQDHQVISIDLRNHGQSFHSDEMNYSLMAQDINHLLIDLNISEAIVVGHSMGGKAAMALTAIASEKIKQLIVLDMAPVAYQTRRHDNVFAGLQKVIEGKPTTRKQAIELLAETVEIEGVRQFLAKSLTLKDGYMQWLFNVDALSKQYMNILGWEPVPAFTGKTLFLKGADSEYILSEYQADIVEQFPNSKAHIIANTGHWLHAEKPVEVVRSIRRFIAK
ncbi:MAG: alpha/beta fold hydrolase [Vibrio sp.]